MKAFRYALCALSTALVVAGCGGGSDSLVTTPQGRFSNLVVFGDSLSDVGTYKVGVIAAAGGGKYTINSPTTKNWTEVLAAQYNLAAPCAAQTGYFSILANAPAIPLQNFSSCRNYAQGSSRVSSPAGPYSVAIQQAIVAAALKSGASQAQANQAAIAADFGLGIIASPLVYQMANHLANAGGGYDGKELVAILAGGNDALMNLSALQSAASGGADAVGRAQFVGWSANVQATVALGGAAAVGAAQQAAIESMTQAGAQLAAAITSQILGKGAKYVAIGNLPDLSKVPFTAPLDDATKGFIRLLVNSFNSSVKTGLAGRSEVIFVDLYTNSQDQVANPAKYGLTNVTDRACASVSAANPIAPQSLGCTAASLIPGDTSKYLFSDDVHLTPIGYGLIAQAFVKSITDAKWP